MLKTVLFACLAVAATTLVQCGDDSSRPAAEAQDPTPKGAASQDHGARPEAEPAPAILGERIHVVVSGSMMGRLEPCGCASGQLGGLPRRIVYLQEIHGADLLIEGGDLVEGASPLDLEKALAALQVLFSMTDATRYDVLGTGPRDLELPLDDWGGYLTSFEAPVVAADLEPVATAFAPVAFVEKVVRGTPVRVVSLAMKVPAAAAEALRLLDPAAGWARGLAGATDDTLRLLMVHAGTREVRALAESLQPRPDVIVAVTADVHEPPSKPEYHAGVPIVYPGIRGRILVDFWFGRTASGGAVTNYDTVPLRGSETKSDAGQDPAAREVLRQHRLYVAEVDLLQQMAGQRPTASGHAYVGNAACGKCHEQDYALWQNSKHGRAWDTLVRAENDPTRYGWPVTRYPDCVGCHVVGYGDETGFVGPDTTPELANVGCERCHGPGSAHVEDPKKWPMGKVGDGSPSRVCTECHDFEQSPDFDYTTRWAIIEHGKQKPR